MLEMPYSNNIDNIDPLPEKIENGWVVWDIKNIAPLEKIKLSFDLKGLEKDAYDENDVYVDGLNPIYLVGAEPWHGIE
jgi:DNA topoisomerase-6 subunit B